MSRAPTVLVSGAGIAGSTLAYWLHRRGVAVTIVERARDLRSSGAPVDVRSAALPVVEQMGIVDQLRAAATTARALVFVDANGLERARTTIAANSTDIELPRGDLASILLGAVRNDIELITADSIASFTQDAGGVDVTFDHAAPRRFDYVIGADGLHSRVRRLVFGPEEQFSTHMGLWFATLPLDVAADNPTEVVMFNAPGRSVTIHPSTGASLAAFIFHGPADASLVRDVSAQKQRIASTYASDGWRVPELLERLTITTDLYFDSVSRVRMPAWSRGRVAVLGDAASCVSLFGGGSTLAIAGAYTLANAMASHAPDAFARYEREHRRLVEPKQRNMKLMSRLLVPRTRMGIVVRNAVLNVMPGRRAATA